MTAPAASTVAAPDEAVRLADDEEISAVEEQLRLLFVRARAVRGTAAPGCRYAGRSQPSTVTGTR